MQLGVLYSVHMQVYSFKVYYDFHTFKKSYIQCIYIYIYMPNGLIYILI